MVNIKSNVVTLRLSSGGKDKENNVEYINFQNFPRDAYTRSCFVSEPGFKWISCDYSGQESRVIADIANDQKMIDLFNNGCGDIHSLVAKMSYPEIIGDCPIEEIKDKFKECRQNAKSIEFAINYGGNADTIQRNSGISKEEAEKVYNNYMKGFSGVKKYQDYQRKTVIKQGFIWLNKKTGHKCNIYNIEQLNKISEQFNDEYWKTYKEYKVAHPDAAIVDEVRTYFREKSNIEKHAINYMCQGTGAVQFKLASIFFYKYLKDNNLLFKVKLLIPAHDEWNVEAPEEIAEIIAKELSSCMKKAGEYFCNKVEFPAVAEIGNHWIH